MSIASSTAVSGMAAATLRLQVSASNVANALSSGPLPGSGTGFAGAYVPQRIDQMAGPGGGTATIVRAVTPAYVPAFDPSAPYADSHGMVASPNVDFASEIIQQIIARYSFAANAQVVRTDAQMMATFLDIAA